MLQRYLYTVGLHEESGIPSTFMDHLQKGESGRGIGGALYRVTWPGD